MTVSLEMWRNTILLGDVREQIQRIPAGIAQMCVTSPPYYRLRDYEIAGQLGQEETLAEYIATQVKVFEEVWRVLRPDGTLWINLGDSYSYETNATGTHGGRYRKALRGRRRPPRYTGLPGKNLIGVPWRVAFALQDAGWILRTEIIWHKPTAIPDNVTDRPSRCHEYIFLFSKQPHYYYDADAVRDPLKPKTLTTYGSTYHALGQDASKSVKAARWHASLTERTPALGEDGEIKGANKRTIWTVASHPFAEEHYATFPPKLIEPAILAGSSPRACEICGAPWCRVSETSPMVTRAGPRRGHYGSRTTDGLSGTMLAPATHRTLGWRASCRCVASAGTGRSLVFDPFMGAGTTALVARQHNRDYLGIELSPRYLKIAERRLAVVQPEMWESSAMWQEEGVI